jgi:hypothetical protein
MNHSLHINTAPLGWPLKSWTVSGPWNVKRENPPFAVFKKMIRSDQKNEEALQLVTVPRPISRCQPLASPVEKTTLALGPLL